MTFQEIKHNSTVNTYIKKADETLAALGYTEHSFAHVTRVAETAQYILKTLGFAEHIIELAGIAGYMHDIGNHDEGTGVPVNEMAAALILADKSDVRRSRVRNIDEISFDIHDRVNYSVEKSQLKINDEHTEILLSLMVDTKYGSVMDYFEIFMQRMLMCRKAAEKLGLAFKLKINGQPLI